MSLVIRSKFRPQWKTTAHLLECLRIKTLTSPGAHKAPSNGSSHHAAGNADWTVCLENTSPSSPLLKTVLEAVLGSQTISFTVTHSYHMIQQSHSSISVLKKWKFCSHKNMYINISSSFTHNHTNTGNSPNVLQSAKGYTNYGVSCDGTLLSNTKNMHWHGWISNAFC